MPRKALVATALVAIVLSGCARVPDSGPAVPVAIPGASQSTDSTITSVNAQLPGPGPDADESVQAYVNALAVTRNPGPLGDRYLPTPALRNAFSQNPSMVVVRGGIEKSVQEAGDEATATFSADLIGTVDSDGVFEEAENPKWQVQVGLTRIKGVWLFAEPPPLIVPENKFTESFSQETVYFSARPTTITGPTPLLVIPERRWLNEDIGDQITQIVDFVLAGPSEALSQVAENPLPNIKRTSRVAVQDGDLVIELEPQAEAMSRDALNAFVAEVGWSLNGKFSGAVRLNVGGRALDVQGFEARQDLGSWRRYNPAIVQRNLPTFQVQKGTVKVLNDPSARDVHRPYRLGTPVLSKSVRVAAISIDLVRFAVVRDEAAGQRLWVGDASGTLQPALRAPQIGRPSWGGNRATVLVPVGGRLFEVGVGNAGRPSEIQVVGPGGRRLRDITSVRLSIDGVRALIVAGNGVYVGTLTGATGRAPVLSVRPMTVPGVPLDVSWLGPLDAAVAVALPDQENRVALVRAPVDGSLAEQHGAIPNTGGPVRVSADPTENPESLVLLEVSGKRYVLRARGGTSDIAPAVATAPFYPG
ncbi:LpqB family beta-propeller domain-containing protein [Cryptosporangium japonicum]|uniref:GerMN domain-containing protein n=1 Tax=Cryptosporangium japonicum TaxID=80872 RepID=A0ABN0TNZ2_9ACTN